MQTFIDFLVNNYLWFIIIALILVFALIGYLVDTSEKANKKEALESDSLENEGALKEPIKMNEPIESLNMDMGTEEIQELDKDIIVMPAKLETSIPNVEQQEQNTTEKTEVLEDFE